MHVTRATAATVAQLASPDALRTAMAHAPSVAAAGQVWLRRQAFVAASRLNPALVSNRPAAIALQALPFSFLEPAGDLTGNGRKDVLDQRLVVSGGEVTTGITARDGRTGRVLWTRKMQSAAEDALPLTIGPLGGHAGRGVLVAVMSASALSQTTESISLSVQAWSGKTGKPVWTSTPITGTISRSGNVETDTDVPTDPDSIHALSSTVADGFIPVESSTTSLTTGNGHGSETATLVNGRNGAQTEPYPTSTSSTDIPELVVTADLNRDKLHDVVAIAPGHPGSLTAEAGNTGAVLWQDGFSIGIGTRVSAVGAVGSGVSDLTVSGEAARLIRGRDGKILWFRGSAGKGTFLFPFVYPISHAGRHGVPIVGLASFGNIDGAHRFGTRVVIRAVADTGRTVWLRRISLSVPDSGTSAEGDADLDPVGDVQPDGAVDLSIFIDLSSGHHHKRLSGVLSGRDGKLHRVNLAGQFPGPADGSLVKGKGTDILSTSPVSGGVRLSGYDGVTGRRLVNVLVRTLAGKSATIPLGMRVTGHRCSDIALLIGQRHRQQDDLLSGSGHRLWQLRFGKSQATGGHLTRYAAPRHFCAA
jgi:hypothetical protein